MGALGWQLDFSRDASVLLIQGATTPPRVDRMGRYILSAADFGKDASRRVRGPAALASFLEIIKKAPDLANGGSHLPDTEAGLYHFEPPLSFLAGNAVTQGDSAEGCLTEPRKIAMKLQVN